MHNGTQNNGLRSPVSQYDTHCFGPNGATTAVPFSVRSSFGTLKAKMCRDTPAMNTTQAACWGSREGGFAKVTNAK